MINLFFDFLQVTGRFRYKSTRVTVRIEILSSPIRDKLNEELEKEYEAEMPLKVKIELL